MTQRYHLLSRLMQSFLDTFGSTAPVKISFSTLRGNWSTQTLHGHSFVHESTHLNRRPGTMRGTVSVNWTRMLTAPSITFHFLYRQRCVCLEIFSHPSKSENRKDRLEWNLSSSKLTRDRPPERRSYAVAIETGNTSSMLRRYSQEGRRGHLNWICG